MRYLSAIVFLQRVVSWFLYNKYSTEYPYFNWLKIASKEISPMYVFGCNFSIRREILTKAGGFHPDGMPQDLIFLRGDGESYVSRFIKENNLKTIYNPKASVFHLVTTERMTKEYFCKRAFNQGVSNSFTEIRSNKGLVENKKNNRKIISKIIKKSRDLLNLPNHVLQNHSTSQEKEIELYAKRGFQYHQTMVKNNQKLLAWVVRQDFFDTADDIKNLKFESYEKYMFL